MYYILLFINYTIWHAMWHILLSVAPSLSSFGAVRIPIFRLPVMARAPAALVRKIHICWGNLTEK